MGTWLSDGGLRIDGIRLRRWLLSGTSVHARVRGYIPFVLDRGFLLDDAVASTLAKVVSCIRQCRVFFNVDRDKSGET